MILQLRKRLVLAFILLILIQEASSIGVTPTNFEVWFEPDKEADYRFAARVRETEPSNVVLYAKGDLSDNIIFPVNETELVPEEWTDFNFTIKFPALMAPGLHENRVGIAGKAKSGPDGGGTGIGVIAGVEILLYVRVPFQGRFLELKNFEISTGEVNKPVEFLITVRNLGKEKVDDATARITIKDGKGELIGTITSDSKQIEPRETSTLRAEWTTSSPGEYIAEALLIYDNNRLTVPPKNFRVGDLLVDIYNVSAPPIKKGEVAKVNVDIRSMWNLQIDKVYADLIVKDASGAQVGEGVSQTVDLGKWSTASLLIYWDSKAMPVGDYTGNVVLHYAGKTSEKPVIIQIKNPSIFAKLEENLLVAVLIGVVILMMIFNLVILLVRRKKNNDKNEKK